MAEITKFQQMNGCSACKYTAGKDPEGNSTSTYGKGFWCSSLNKAVDSGDGVACASWEYES